MHDELAEPLIIFGHSLGAMVAAAVAAELPQLVLGIVLEDPLFTPWETAALAAHGKRISSACEKPRGAEEP